MAQVFTLKEIEEAYEWCGINPVAGKAMERDRPRDKPTCGCPMFVVACKRKGIRPEDWADAFAGSLSASLGLTMSEFWSFVDAFDGVENHANTSCPEWRELGLAARERFIAGEKEAA